MKQLFLPTLVFLSLAVQGQKVLKGVVVDEEKNKPLQNVSVFLNTTSIGTTTSEQGTFILSIPGGLYELIISSVGFETHNQIINSNELPEFLTVRLKIKSKLLQTVTVEPYEPNGWEKWGQFFLESFIGISTNAQDCRIKNTEVVHFRHSKANGELTAIADKPLIIENKALGYTIMYQLESFKYDFKHRYLVYTGYPFFLPMNGSDAKRKRWESRRKDIYYGSLMHFMRSVYRNTLTQEGFEVRSLKKAPAMGIQLSKNGEDYYDQISNPDNYKDMIGTALPGDSIAYAVNRTTAGLDFTNFLLVTYKNKMTPSDYTQQFPKSSTVMMSQIILINRKPIEIQANGSFYNPADLLSAGYWAWSEKMARMLPFDYVPPKP